MPSIVNPEQTFPLISAENLSESPEPSLIRKVSGAVPIGTTGDEEALTHLAATLMTGSKLARAIVIAPTFDAQ